MRYLWPVTRTTPVVSAQIPRRHDVVVLGWLYTAFMFLLTSGVRFLARGDAHFDLVPYLWVASVVFAGLAAAAVAFRLWRRARLELTRDAVRYVGHARAKTLQVAGVVRLGLVEFGTWSKLVSIETASERILLTFLARRLPREFEAVLDAVAARTGLAWKGRGERGPVSGRADFRAFLGAWREAVGSTWRQVLRWILTHSIYPRFDKVAVNSVFLRWGYGISMMGLSLFVLLAVFPADLASEGRERAAVWTGLGLLAAGWCVTCLGVNLAVLFLDREVRRRESFEAELEAARAGGRGGGQPAHPPHARRPPLRDPGARRADAGGHHAAGASRPPAAAGGARRRLDAMAGAARPGPRPRPRRPFRRASARSPRRRSPPGTW